MKTYTINGKEYTEFDINKRCAEIMGDAVLVLKMPMSICLVRKGSYSEYSPCQKPEDTWPIIERVWDELNELVDEKGDIATIGTVLRFEKTKFNWQHLIEKHNCTKLVAACICLIEVNEGI